MGVAYGTSRGRSEDAQPRRMVRVGSWPERERMDGCGSGPGDALLALTVELKELNG